MSAAQAIILAAGSSQRMGRDKASLPWLDGKPLLLWMTEALIRTGWQPTVVLGPHNISDWQERLPGVRVVVNPDPAKGKATSLLAGVQALPQTTENILLTAIDQPRPPALFEQLLHHASHSSHRVIVPDYRGHRGHPVVVSRELQDDLLSAADSSLGLRGFLDRRQSHVWRMPCDPEWLRWDLNTPAEYREALGWFQSGA